MDHSKLENSKTDGNTNHLTCLLRNLYAAQESTVRTGHGTTDYFQIGDGVRQVCIQFKKQQLELDMEKETGSKLEKS